MTEPLDDIDDRYSPRGRAEARAADRGAQEVGTVTRRLDIETADRRVAGRMRALWSCDGERWKSEVRFWQRQWRKAQRRAAQRFCRAMSFWPWDAPFR